jgi:hypothetical protein
MMEPLKVKIDQKRQAQPGDRLFDPLNDLLIIISAIAHASSLMAGGSTHTNPKPVMRVTTRWPDYGLALPLRGPLECALTGQPVALIEIGIMTDPSALLEKMPDIKLETGGLHAVMRHVISPIFLMFFERYNVWLTDNLGDAQNWPPTLNFCRVVRNAMAHGKINIRNPNAPNVSWRDLSFGYADNGTQIIGPGMQLGEIIALMFDASDALDGINAPVL